MVAESVGNTFTPCLHCATAPATPAALAPPVVAVELEPVDPLVVAELLGLELPELPQPAISAVVASSTSADGKSFRITVLPLL